MVKCPRGRQGQRGDTNPNNNISTCSPGGRRSMRRAQKGRESVIWFMSNSQTAGEWPVSDRSVWKLSIGIGLKLCDWLKSLTKILQGVIEVKSCINTHAAQIPYTVIFSPDSFSTRRDYRFTLHESLRFSFQQKPEMKILRKFDYFSSNMAPLKMWGKVFCFLKE